MEKKSILGIKNTFSMQLIQEKWGIMLFSGQGNLVVQGILILDQSEP